MTLFIDSLDVEEESTFVVSVNFGSLPFLSLGIDTEFPDFLK